MDREISLNESIQGKRKILNENFPQDIAAVSTTVSYCQAASLQKGNIAKWGYASP